MPRDLSDTLFLAVSAALETQIWTCSLHYILDLELFLALEPWFWVLPLLQ